MKTKDGAALRVIDLLYQSLETEMGGVEIYRMALLCAKNAELNAEWTKYLAQTVRHVQVLRDVFDALGLDPEATTPGRQIVRDKAKGLLAAMQKALMNAPLAAEVVACECVVDAETKDHANWELLSALAQSSPTLKKALADACAEVEDEEDEHLYHTKGWCRELWRESLGLDAQLPPPEEIRNVKSAGAAARAAATRTSKNGGRGQAARG